MKVLITGIAGFLGSHVAEHCIKLGMEVVGVDDLSGGNIANLPEGANHEGVNFFNRDCSSAHEMAYLFEQQGPFDAVYHLAAYAAEGLSHFIRRFNYENNLGATATIVNECVKQGDRTGKMPHLVFTSSIAVYGYVPAGCLPVTEERTPSPIDPYGIAKYACELDIQAAAEMFGLTYTIYRPYNIYGERQNLNDPYRNVVGIFMRKALTGEPFPIFGDGSQQRAFSYVDDVAPVIAVSPLISKAKNTVLNVGGETPFSVKQLAEMVSESFGIPTNIAWLEPRNEVQMIYATPAKVHGIFGHKTPTKLIDGIERMAKWAKTQTIAPPKPFANVEVNVNMPPSWKALVK